MRHDSEPIKQSFKSEITLHQHHHVIRFQAKPFEINLPRQRSDAHRIGISITNGEQTHQGKGIRRRREGFSAEKQNSESRSPYFYSIIISYRASFVKGKLVYKT